MRFTRKQWLVVALLAAANCAILGGLAGVMVVAPRLAGGRSAALPTARATAYPTETPAALPPTWTPTSTSSPVPTMTRSPTATPLPTRTPLVIPTYTPAPKPVVLENADFEDILPDGVPGWEVAAVVNWRPGDDFDADTSYADPFFKPADDDRRVISGSTLQIESAYQYVKFQVTLYQTVDAKPGSQAQFEVKTRGYSNLGSIQVRAGVDPGGGAACEGGVWGELQAVDQGSGVVILRSPGVVVGPEGRVTVCFSAEPQYATSSKAAFFDDALLLILPPAD